MSTEIHHIQEHRNRLYKHANRPVPLQNIRLNISENPYHRVIRGNTYNLRTSSSGLVRITPQLPQNERFLQSLNDPMTPPQRPNQFSQYQAIHMRQTPKKVNALNRYVTTVTNLSTYITIDVPSEINEGKKCKNIFYFDLYLMSILM